MNMFFYVLMYTLIVCLVLSPNGEEFLNTFLSADPDHDHDHLIR